MEQQKQQEMKLKRRERLKMSVAPEPAVGEKDSTSLVFRLIDGSRLTRRFKSTEKLQVVYDFLDSLDNLADKLPERYALVTNFPRKTFTEKNMNLSEAGLVPQSALFIEDLDEKTE